MFRSTKPYCNQDYDKLKKGCLSGGKLFVDPLFPPQGSSLFHSHDAQNDVVWKRPGEIARKPQLFVGGADASDFKQGQLGNCWFVAACACIAETPKLWKKIVPDYEKQEWSPENKYAGIFHFHFYRTGEWIDVVIDDYLPTRNGHLIYTCSNDENEFWSALLEKAYAKLFGDYESLTAGKSKDALVDMLGGVGQSIDVRAYKNDEDKQSKLFEELLEAHDQNSQMTASISASGDEMEAKMSNGLIKGHAYSVTDVRRIRQGKGILAFFKNEKLDMLRLRNPWGKTEWTGAWSDQSKEWANVSEGEREDIGLTTSDNGEFWMSFKDFLENYTNMDICHMINTSFFSISKTWHRSQTSCKWTKPNRAGGCSNHTSFLDNPQYIIDVKECVEEVIFSLEQEDQRMNRPEGKQNGTIGLTVLKADLNREYRMHDKLERIATSEFTNSRSIFHRVTLDKGRYLIVPSTFDPGFETSYWLRVYCGKNVDLKELVEERPKNGGCCGSKYKVATQLHIHKAVGLQKMERGGADPYCIVKCEGKEYKTPVCEDTLNPEWKWRVVLYRKSTNTDIHVEIWNHNMFADDFMAQVIIQGTRSKNKENDVYAYSLSGRKKEAAMMKLGKLSLQFKHFDDLGHA